MNKDYSELFFYWMVFDRETYRDLMFQDIAYNTRKINQNLANIEYSINETNVKLDRLSEDVNRHLTNINAELVLQSKIFTNIQNILENKRKTESEELKKFGIFAFQNAWYEESKEDLLESLKFNKYDYHVYFFLSKVFGNLGELDSQNDYINKAFKYGIQDDDFLQFVYMDMVSICISGKDYDSAEKLLKKSFAIKKSTASCLTSALLDINRNNVSDETFTNIEFAIENYDSESPARVIEAVEVISKMLNDDSQAKIRNIINKCKFKIIKNYTGILYQKINNLVDILSQIAKDNEFIVNIVPQHLINQYCYNFNKIDQITLKLSDLKEKLKNVSIDSYNEVVTLPSLINYITNKMIIYYRLVLDFQTEGSILTNPFSQKFKPDLKIQLDQNDIILIQTILHSNKYISLTTNKIIITKELGVSTIFALEGFDNLELNIINTKESSVSFDNGSIGVDILTFMLKKIDTDQIVLIDKSLEYSHNYGSRNKSANLLNLLWSLSKNNSNIINSMIGIDSALIFIDAITKSSLERLTAGLNNIKSSDEDVEFID